MGRSRKSKRKGNSVNRNDPMHRELSIEKVVDALWTWGAMSAPHLAVVTGISETTVRRTLRDCARLGCVQKLGPWPVQGGGRPYYTWDLG